MSITEGRPLLSIITVCFNDAAYLNLTLENIRAQTYSNIELVVIDGGSTDDTLKIIERHKDIISYWCCEPDQGIYDAMNKGLKMISGDYVLFINAGDELYDKDVVAYAMAQASGYEILYGDAIHINPDGSFKSLRHKKIPAELTWKNFRTGMVVSHQALFVSSSLWVHYNLRYKISADIDWAIRCLKKTDKVYNLKIKTSKFRYGGVSSRRRVFALMERWLILQDHYGFFQTLRSHIGILVSKIIKMT